MIIQRSRPAFLFFTVLLVVLGFIFNNGVAKAAAVQTADTISTAGIEFTESAPAKADTVVAVTQSKPTAIKAAGAIGVKETEKPKTLWQIFIAGLLGGFAALIMPCIYPLLPLTVSFFTKKAGSRSKGIWHSLIYGISIIVIYVTLGLIITLVFGSDALNSLATSGVFNLFFFVLLVVFGIKAVWQ